MPVGCSFTQDHITLLKFGIGLVDPTFRSEDTDTTMFTADERVPYRPGVTACERPKSILRQYNRAIRTMPGMIATMQDGSQPVEERMSACREAADTVVR